MRRSRRFRKEDPKKEQKTEPKISGVKRGREREASPSDDEKDMDSAKQQQLKAPDSKKRRILRRPLEQKIVKIQDISLIAPKSSRDSVETRGICVVARLAGKDKKILRCVIANESGFIEIKYKKDIELYIRTLEIDACIDIKWNYTQINYEKNPLWNMGSIDYSLINPLVTSCNIKNNITLPALELNSPQFTKISDIRDSEDETRTNIIGYVISDEPSKYGSKAVISDETGVWTYMVNDPNEIPSNKVILLIDIVLKDEIKGTITYRNIKSGFQMTEKLMIKYYSKLIAEFLSKKDDFVTQSDGFNSKFNKDDYLLVSLKKLCQKINYVFSNQTKIDEIYIFVWLENVKIELILNTHDCVYFSLKTDPKHKPIPKEELDKYTDDELNCHWKVRIKVSQPDSKDINRLIATEFMLFGKVADKTMGMTAEQFCDLADDKFDDALNSINGKICNIWINNKYDEFKGRIELKQSVAALEFVIKEENNGEDINKEKENIVNQDKNKENSQD